MRVRFLLRFQVVFCVFFLSMSCGIKADQPKKFTDFLVNKTIPQESIDLVCESIDVWSAKDQKEARNLVKFLIKKGHSDDMRDNNSKDTIALLDILNKLSKSGMKFCSRDARGAARALADSWIDDDNQISLSNVVRIFKAAEKVFVLYKPAAYLLIKKRAGGSSCLHHINISKLEAELNAADAEKHSEKTIRGYNTALTDVADACIQKNMKFGQVLPVIDVARKSMGIVGGGPDASRMVVQVVKDLVENDASGEQVTRLIENAYEFYSRISDSDRENRYTKGKRNFLDILTVVQGLAKQRISLDEIERVVAAIKKVEYRKNELVLAHAKRIVEQGAGDYLNKVSTFIKSDLVTFLIVRMRGVDYDRTAKALFNIGAQPKEILNIMKAFEGAELPITCFSYIEGITKQENPDIDTLTNQIQKNSRVSDEHRYSYYYHRQNDSYLRDLMRMLGKEDCVLSDSLKIMDAILAADQYASITHGINVARELVNRKASANDIAGVVGVLNRFYYGQYPAECTQRLFQASRVVKEMVGKRIAPQMIVDVMSAVREAPVTQVGEVLDNLSQSIARDQDIKSVLSKIRLQVSGAKPAEATVTAAPEATSSVAESSPLPEPITATVEELGGPIQASAASPVIAEPVTQVEQQAASSVVEPLGATAVIAEESSAPDYAGATAEPPLLPEVVPVVVEEELSAPVHRGAVTPVDAEPATSVESDGSISLFESGQGSSQEGADHEVANPVVAEPATVMEESSHTGRVESATFVEPEVIPASIEELDAPDQAEAISSVGGESSEKGWSRGAKIGTAAALAASAIGATIGIAASRAYAHKHKNRPTRKQLKLARSRGLMRSDIPVKTVEDLSWGARMSVKFWRAVQPKTFNRVFAPSA